MKSINDLFERTSLHALGTFIVDPDKAMRILEEREPPLEARMESAYDGLRLALLNGGENRSERVRRAADEIRDVAWYAGFLAGMKAGARVVLALTDAGEVLP